MTHFPALPFLETNPGDATGCVVVGSISRIQVGVSLYDLDLTLTLTMRAKSDGGAQVLARFELC